MTWHWHAVDSGGVPHSNNVLNYIIEHTLGKTPDVHKIYEYSETHFLVYCAHICSWVLLLPIVSTSCRTCKCSQTTPLLHPCIIPSTNRAGNEVSSWNGKVAWCRFTPPYSGPSTFSQNILTLSPAAPLPTNLIVLSVGTVLVQTVVAGILLMWAHWGETGECRTLWGRVQDGAHACVDVPQIISEAWCYSLCVAVGTLNIDIFANSKNKFWDPAGIRTQDLQNTSQMLLPLDYLDPWQRSGRQTT